MNYGPKTYDIITGSGRNVGSVVATNNSAAIVNALKQWPPKYLGLSKLEGIIHEVYETYYTQLRS